MAWEQLHTTRTPCEGTRGTRRSCGCAFRCLEHLDSQRWHRQPSGAAVELQNGPCCRSAARPPGGTPFDGWAGR
eukprot:4499877-Pyramimonas_sp.AAC.1